MSTTIVPLYKIHSLKKVGFILDLGLYITVLLLLAISFYKDRQKTKQAIKKAFKAFENILPEFLVVITLVGFLLAFIEPEIIANVIGADSGWLGVIIAAIVGSVTLIPGFVAFPTAALLLQGGAGYMQLGAFISTLMMVGIVTLPLEIKYFGIKLAICRNLLAFLFSLLIAYIIGLVVPNI